jgi:hypothetical protein
MPLAHSFQLYFVHRSLILETNPIQYSRNPDFPLYSPSSVLHPQCVHSSAPTTRSHNQRSLIRSLIHAHHSLNRNVWFTHPRTPDNVDQ